MITGRLLLSYAILCAIIVLPTGVFAGVTGKVSGTVADSRSGKPIVGASVVVVGTNQGTKTDMDGEYFIINVPGGKYEITVTSVGFEAVTKRDVRVLVDLTTPVSFDLREETVELDRQVVVYAENPTIQKDLTSSRVIFTVDRLKTLPNIITVKSVLTNYPGVVVDRDQDLHIRGGRAGQVSYYFDGFSIQDPFIATSGMHIIPSALEELSLTSGGYTAEYGEALSGVVSAVTRDGGSEYHGGLKTYQGFTHPYDVTTGDWGDLSFDGNRAMAFNLSGPVPGLQRKKFAFFAAGEYLHDPTALPHNGIASYTGTMKLSMQPLPQLKLKTNLTYYDASGQVYDHRDVNGRSYDFNLDGLPSLEKNAYLLGITGNYHLNENVVLTSSLNRFYTRTKSAPAHLFDVYWDQWPGYSEDASGVYNGTVHEDNYAGNRDFTDPLQAVGFTVDDDYYPTYRFRESQYDAFVLSLLTQLNKVHQVKSGFEVRRNDIAWDFKQFFNDQPFGELYYSHPLNLSAFVQDKMEYDNMIINVGVRYDYRDADIAYNVTPQNIQPSWKDADAVSRISPRLGVSFPITETSVMHFNYGVYYQSPRYTYMYTNLQGDISTGLPLLGNPDLAPEQTVSYELGLDHMLGRDLRFDITAYYKDVEDLVTTRSTFEVASNSVTFFDNGDYGSVKGFDISLEKLPIDGYFSGSISYGYMIANGNSTNALEPYYTYINSTEDTLAPISEYPLDFDQRHTLTAVLDFHVPFEWRGDLLGLTIPGAWGATMVGHYGSGLPYTATDASGNRLGERNEGRLPANYTVDLRVNKDFRLMRGQLLSLFVEVDNLINERNVLNVYSRTGVPDDDGQITGAGLALDQDVVTAYDNLYDHDPQNFNPPRTIRTGLEFNF